jgi:hypothetical protein
MGRLRRKNIFLVLWHAQSLGRDLQAEGAACAKEELGKLKAQEEKRLEVSE